MTNHNRLNIVMHSLRQVTRVTIAEKNPAQLIKKVTEHLGTSGEYQSVWMILLNKKGQVLDVAVSSAGKENSEIKQDLLQGVIPFCGQEILAHLNESCIAGPRSKCSECLVERVSHNIGSLTIRIEHEGQIFGLLGLHFAWELLSHDEQMVLTEATNDIAWALHLIELELDQNASQQILQRSPVILFRWKNKTGWPIEYVSENVKTLTGYTRADFQAGRPPYMEIIHSGDRDRVDEEVRQNSQYKETSEFTHEPYRIVSHDEEVKWIEDKTRIIRDSQGEITHYEGIIFDVTERQKAQSAFRESEDRYRKHLEAQVRERTKELRSKNDALMNEFSKRKSAEKIAVAALDESERIFQTAANGMRVVDMNFNTLKANAAFAEVCGIPLDKIVGSKCYDTFPGENCKKSNCSLARVKEGGALQNLEVHKNSTDGQQLLCTLHATPLLDQDGKLMGMIEAFQDVTEQRRFQSIADAINLTDNIGYVFGGIRHELGNPINNMKATLTVMNNKLSDLSTDSIAEQLGWVFEEITRVEFLLQNLKSFNLFEKLKCERLDLVKFIEQFQSLVADDLSKSGIHMYFKLPPQTAWVDTDQRALQQVLLNLVSNAADALDERKEPTIIIQIKPENMLVHLDIKDNGSGMNPQQLAKIFKPFYTNKKTGTGLGMTIVKKILAKMDCTIEIESEKNVGTTVSIQLPVVALKGGRD